MYALNSKFVVHYDFAKSIISNKEKLVLDSLIKKLVFLPKTFISIGAFTDCIGSYKYNYRLSVKRGKAVVDYLLKHGLDKQRIIANGYSKKYTISPCITKYTSKNKLLQQNSRRAEIVLSENKKTDWASLELQRGKNYYALYNSSNAKPNLILNANNNIDSIRNILATNALNTKMDRLLKAKLESIKQDSIKAVQASLANEAVVQKVKAQKQAEEEVKLLAERKAKEKALILPRKLYRSCSELRNYIFTS
jgi:flagellar motor protein MotB